jgi:hypothetical protein
MNKLTKYGVSALCGSLAGIASANAGELAVSGGADMTWSSLENTNVGNPIGMGSNIGFTGTGELDNGTAVTLSIAYTNKAAYSASNVTLDMPSMGSLTITQGVSGTGIDRLDDKGPTAWEETTGTALGTGIQTVTGASAGAGFEWTPNADMLPSGLAAHIAYSPMAAAGSANDKKTTADNSGTGYGVDLVLEHSGLAEGLNVYAGVSRVEQTDASVFSDDRKEWAIGAEYAISMITLGYEVTKKDLNTIAASTTAYYENNIWGVAVAVSDNLSISYGSHESERNLVGTDNVTAKAKSWQAAYSMGGASFRVAHATVDNASYTSGTGSDKDGTTLSLSLAF